MVASGGTGKFSVYLNSLEVNSSSSHTLETWKQISPPLATAAALLTRDVISFFSKTRNSTTSRGNVALAVVVDARRSVSFSSLLSSRRRVTRRMRNN